MTLYNPSECRRMAGFSLRDLADEMEIHYAFLSNLENSKRAWTLDVAYRWIQVVHPKLEKLPKGRVDWEKVPGEIEDFITLNEEVEGWSLMASWLEEPWRWVL